MGVFSYMVEAAAMFLFRASGGKNREAGSRKISVRKFICDPIN
jgi:hypothetical protein